MIREYLPVFAALALVAACAANPWTVDHFEAPEADLPGKHSFAYRPGELTTPLVQKPAEVADLEAKMRAAITAELVRKGYAQAADAAGADLVVSYQAAGTRRFVESDQRRIGAPSPNELLTPGSIPPPAASELPPEKSVRDVSVVVFVDQPASGRLVWRGLVSVETRASSTEALVRQVVDMARHITQQFPARRTAP